MKILITGYRGFIGRHFVKALDKPENDILGIDILDGNDCRTFFRDPVASNFNFDLVIHCAAIVEGRDTIENNPLRIATDLSIDSEMFYWAAIAKPKKIVYFSSSAAYPIDYQDPTHPDFKRHLREDMIDFHNIKEPDFTYGWTKLTGERLAYYAEQKAGLDVAVFRPFSGYGADQATTYPFRAFIERIKALENPFEIWGDGTQTRDFIHVDDIVDSVLIAVKENIKGAINLGSGEATNFNDLAKLMMKVSGHKAEIKHLTDKPVGVSYRVSDNSKMLSFYKPKISLEEGIRMALR